MTTQSKASRKSVVLVTIDSLRADHVGFHGYAAPTTPFLDSLAQAGTVFEAAVAAGAPTYYSLPSILASRYPLSLGRDIVGLAPGEETIASVLQRAGYATACFSAGNPYVSKRFGFDAGFDIFEDFLESSAPGSPVENSPCRWTGKLNRQLARASRHLGPLGSVYDELYFQYCQRIADQTLSLDALRPFPTADVIVDRATAWLNSVGPRRFFLWLHFMDPHSPYYPAGDALDNWCGRNKSPSELRYLNSYWNRSDLSPSRLSSKKKQIVTLYDAAIHWVDAQLSRLVGELKAQGHWQNCIFAATADHGEEFLDHDGRYHPPNRLTEELLHVPLLIRVPDAAKRRWVKSPFSLLHLSPTLLHIAGVWIPTTFQGTSCWSDLEASVALAEPCIAEAVSGCTNPFVASQRLRPRVLAVRDGNYKLHLQFDPWKEELYDLSRDPSEKSPIPVGAERVLRRRLLQLAADHVQQAVNQRDTQLRLKSKIREVQLQWRHLPANLGHAAS